MVKLCIDKIQFSGILRSTAEHVALKYSFFFLALITSKITEHIREGIHANNINKPITNLPSGSKLSKSGLYIVIKLYIIKGSNINAGIYLIYLFLLNKRFNSNVTRIDTTTIIVIIIPIRK